MLIKIILIVPLAALIGLFLLRVKNKTFYRLFLIGVAALGVFFVLNPEATTQLAHMVGVGRGTDLILYLCVIAFFLAFMVMYAKLRKVEATQTALIRQMALANAKKPQ